MLRKNSHGHVSGENTVGVGQSEEVYLAAQIEISILLYILDPTMFFQTVTVFRKHCLPDPFIPSSFPFPSALYRNLIPFFATHHTTGPTKQPLHQFDQRWHHSCIRQTTFSFPQMRLSPYFSLIIIPALRCEDSYYLL